jgi:hypothetical protein
MPLRFRNRNSILSSGNVRGRAGEAINHIRHVALLRDGVAATGY